MLNNNDDVNSNNNAGFFLKNGTLVCGCFFGAILSSHWVDTDDRGKVSHFLFPSWFYSDLWERIERQTGKNKTSQEAAKTTIKNESVLEHDSFKKKRG